MVYYVLILILIASSVFHIAVAIVNKTGRLSTTKDFDETSVASSYVQSSMSYPVGIGASKTELLFHDYLFKRRRRYPAIILNWALQAKGRRQKAHHVVSCPFSMPLLVTGSRSSSGSFVSSNRERLAGISNRPAAFIATMGKRESPMDFMPKGTKPRIN